MTPPSSVRDDRGQLSRPRPNLFDAAAVARCFDLGRVVGLSEGPVSQGKQGQVWRLDTSDGSFAVKVAFGDVFEAQADGPATFQEAAHAAGVPTPALVRTREGTVFGEVAGLADASAVSDGGAAADGVVQVRVHAWVDLGPPDPLVDPGAVGELVAAIHRLDVPGQGDPDPWSHEPVGAQRWDDLVTELRAAGAPFAEQLADLRDELVALEGWLEPPGVLRTCHRDLWADNVLPAADGGLCVIDWEDSGPADPTMELAAVLFEFGRTDPGRARALVGAYRAGGGPAAVSRRGHFTMLIAQLGHITATASADWLRPNRRSPSRAAAHEWVRETLEEPHTRAVLDGLLAAVAGQREQGGRPGPGRAR
ncbi:MAG: phosphotransferase [Pedococcus sp.]